MSDVREVGLLRVGLARVQGRSMLPTLAEGDRLVVRYGGRVEAGVLVLARFPDGTLAVKRVDGPRPTRAGGQGWWLVSDNPAEGVDSRHRGPVPHGDVLAVVVARLWRRPLCGRRRFSSRGQGVFRSR